MIRHPIQHVVEARLTEGRWEYFVEWKGLPLFCSEWIAEDRVVTKNKHLYDARVEFYRRRSIEATVGLAELIRKPVEGGDAVGESNLFRLFGRLKILSSPTSSQPTFTPIICSIPPKDQVDSPVSIGCSCTSTGGGCSTESSCLCILESETPNYSSDGLLLREENEAIYECNSSCSCSLSCPNRVCQRGSFCNFLIKMTTKGWGLVAMDPIAKGTFIGAYAGKIITLEQSSKLSSAPERRSYLFDLDYYNSTTPTQYTIDAFKYGNHTRFINHSCQPNSRVHPIFTNDGWNPSLHQLAIFSSRDIRRGEEISFDYRGGASSKGLTGGNECKCGERNCKGLF